MDAISTATSGMTAALSRFDQAAGAIASPNGDLAQAAVLTIDAKASFTANAAVLKTADEMMGALLDILA
ncbi:MAG TPA: flagellar basal body rod C-terminal domain-containing protein [Caulobacteraceae bacterium]|nr:flagellar basal body rod C-terminal domain-containing protein [Caulobacteraceae bacterium]